MGFGRINEIKKQRGMTNAQISTISGIPLSTLDKITAGINTNPKLDTMKALASALKCRLDDFDDSSQVAQLPRTSTLEKYRALDSHGKEVVDSVICIEYDRIQKEKSKPTLPTQELERVETRKIPVESSLASAGRGYDLSDNQEGRKYITIVNTLENSRADYATYVTGSSMEPKIYDGDLLLIREQPAVNIGEFGLFCIRGVHDHGVVKEYASDRLISLNPEYDDIYFGDLGETEEVVCVGKVVNVIHDYDTDELME